MTILELLERAAAERPDATALAWPAEDGVRGVGWEEFTAGVRDMAAGFRSIGIRDGDRVAIVMPNCPELLYVELGVIAAGGVAVSIDPAYQTSFLRHSLAGSSFRFKVVAGDKILGRTEFAGFLDVELILARDPLRRIPPRPVMSLKELTQRGAQAASGLPNRDPSATSKLALTAGCTHLVKQVALSQTAMLAAGRGLASALSLGAGRTYLSMSHLSSSWTLQEFLACAHSGARFSFMEYAPHPTEFMRGLALLRPDVLRMSRDGLLEEFHAMFDPTLDDRYWALGLKLRLGATLARICSWGVGMLPRSATRSLCSDVLNRLLLGGISRLVVSGGTLPGPVSSLLAGLGAQVSNSYGLTEACGFVTVAPAGSTHLGKPLPGVGMEVSEDGEIVLSGPTLMSGYAGVPRGAACVLDDGQLRTRDL
ncbi:AMP-binding protein, partial [Elusimicrobiota bacterium]